MALSCKGGKSVPLTPACRQTERHRLRGIGPIENGIHFCLPSISRSTLSGFSERQTARRPYCDRLVPNTPKFNNKKAREFSQALCRGGKFEPPGGPVATGWSQTPQNSTTKKPEISLRLFVGVARFELATFWSQTRRDDRATLHPDGAF